MENGDDGASSFIPDIAHFELCSSINLCTKFVLIHFTQRHRLWLAAHGAKIITSHQTCERASERELARGHAKIYGVAAMGTGSKPHKHTHRDPHVQRNRGLLLVHVPLDGIGLLHALQRFGALYVCHQSANQTTTPAWPVVARDNGLVRMGCSVLVYKED